MQISVGKTEISVIFPVFATHRDRNFGPENCIFEFQIQKYKIQILVKQTKFRTVKTKLLTLLPCQFGQELICIGSVATSPSLIPKKKTSPLLMK